MLTEVQCRTGTVRDEFGKNIAALDKGVGAVGFPSRREASSALRLLFGRRFLPRRFTSNSLPVIRLRLGASELPREPVGAASTAMRVMVNKAALALAA